MNTIEGGPLYKGVQRALLDQLSSGALKPGQLIPSERELATEFAVSIGTLRKAIDDLVEQRILIRQQGKGTFVATHDRERLLFYFFHLVPQVGVKSYPLIEFVSFHKALATAEIAQRLRIAVGAPIFHIRNRLSLESDIVSVDDLFLEQARFATLTAAQFKERPNTIYNLYQEAFGYTVVKTDERLRAVACPEEHAKLLKVSPGAPVLTIRRSAIDMRSETVEFRISTVNTAKHEYFAELL
ncbi:MAG: GntR family transcriptional regulator [Betaproteobacteria bacterium]|nr:MAG: GntR family transcriptional regulator [Betaproteobacteria bacterium]